MSRLLTVDEKHFVTWALP